LVPTTNNIRSADIVDQYIETIKLSSRILVPTTNNIRSADIVDQYIGTIKLSSRILVPTTNNICSAEYISTPKAAVIKVANKLAASEKTIATCPVSTTVEEVAVVDKEKEITNVEL